MKIIYIANMRLPTEKAHGAQIMKTCEAFTILGHDVELIIPWRLNSIKDNPLEYYGIKNKFKITKTPAIDLIWLGRIGFWVHLFGFSQAVVFYLLFKKADIIYSRDEIPLYFTSFIKRNIFWETHTGRLNFLIKRLIKRCKGVVAITSGLKEFYVLSGIEGGKIAVAPDGIDLNDFICKFDKSAVRLKNNLSANKKIVLYVGRLDSWKGVETLLAASKLFPVAQTVIIGGEPAQIKHLKNRYPNVVFLGARPYRNIGENQAIADVLVLPNSGKDKISSHFTSPLKLFSYMASGTPIVSSDLPSIREVLNENNAVFFKSDYPESLAESIKTILRDGDLSDKISKQALLDVREYTWTKRADRIMDFIKSKI